MRALRILIIGLGLVVIAAGVTAAMTGSSRSTAFAKQADAIETRWQMESREGIPAGQFTPLRDELARSEYRAASWWSPLWWAQTGQSLIDQLSRETDAVWAGAMAAARTDAAQPITSWRELQAQLGAYLPTDLVAAAGTWPAQEQQATTPAALAGFASVWTKTVATARQQAVGAQLDAQVAQLGGVRGVLKQAQVAEDTAQRINLDDEGIGVLANALRSEIAAEQDARGTLSKLVEALGSFHQLLSLNNNVAGTLRPVQLAVDQAVAESTPNGRAYLSQYSSIASGLAAARVPSELTSVAQQLATLQANVTAELANSQCGHVVPAGKVIIIALGVQEAIFYQDGCVVKATPVTTGRAQLRTPTGTFHVFFKQSPFQFISPWPKESPFYYFPSWVSWVMEFAGGGYFLHDAPWEAASQYGPGSEDSSGASHGCIHIPTDVMRWAYQWTPMGAPVVITG